MVISVGRCCCLRCPRCRFGLKKTVDLLESTGTGRNRLGISLKEVSIHFRRRSFLEFPLMNLGTSGKRRCISVWLGFAGAPLHATPEPSYGSWQRPLLKSENHGATKKTFFRNKKKKNVQKKSLANNHCINHGDKPRFQKHALMEPGMHPERTLSEGHPSTGKPC